MKLYQKKIKSYKKMVRTKYIRESAIQNTIKVCQNVDISSEFVRTSYFEFLYEQAGFIRKRWWLLQAGTLFLLWIWLPYTNGLKDMVRLLGILATVFVILIIPEIWKNRKCSSVEIEQAAYYTLRQVYAARMVLFAFVDLLMIMLFLTVTIKTVSISFADLIINFLLPVNVASCICFRLLYSKWAESEYLAILFSLIWIGIWSVVITNDAVYQRIAMPVWAGLIAASFLYLLFCMRKSLNYKENIMEELIDGIRI